MYSKLKSSIIDLKAEPRKTKFRVDFIIHNQKKYIIETKIWRGDSRYQAGKSSLHHISNRRDYRGVLYRL